MLDQKRGTEGWVLGLVGVVGFSLTLPATRVAVAFMGPDLVGFGRAVLAALAAAAVLALRRERLPRPHLRELLWVAAGVVLGFPFLSAWAMQRVPATHGAVMLAILPLATAGAGALFARERPSPSFWAASAVGSLSIIGYAAVTGTGHLRPADFALLGAALLAAAGYAAGGRIAREIGGWRVICWALVLALPLTAPPAVLAGMRLTWAAVPLRAWLGLLYVALGSQLLFFFAWYRGLALGGVARVGQVQYLQVFLTLGWSAWWLGERVTWLAAAAAAVVVAAVAAGSRAAVTRPETTSARLGG